MRRLEQNDFARRGIHSEAGPLTLSQLLERVTGHIDHHVGFIREKRAALSHFQPHGVLISTGEERAERRAFNEQVLDSGSAVHRELGGQMADKVDQEANELIDAARRAGSLSWDLFAQAWWRAVRRVVLGDAAREDHHVTELLSRLRRDANWAYLKPVRARLRDQFLARVRAYIRRAEPGSQGRQVCVRPAAGP